MKQTGEHINEMDYHLASRLIAPCGMNCGICLAFLREKNRCNGCRLNDSQKTSSRTSCIIKNCSKLIVTKSGFCYECEKFPCTRLKQLDKRYQTRYNMSMLQNLKTIESKGLHSFVVSEQKRWVCPNCGATLCVHRELCLECKQDILPV